MRRTGSALLFGLAVVGGTVGWLLQVALVASGAPSFIPPVTSYTVLLIIAVAVLLLAWPVRRSVRGKRRQRIDPFFAMRVLALAKASSVMGGLLSGFSVSLVIYAWSRVGGVSTPGFWPSVLLGVGSVAMLVAGLIAESWCRVPPEDPPSPPRAAMEAR